MVNYFIADSSDGMINIGVRCGIAKYFTGDDYNSGMVNISLVPDEG